MRGESWGAKCGEEKQNILLLRHAYCILHNIRIGKGDMIDTRLYEGYVPIRRPQEAAASDNATESHELRSTLMQYL